VGNGKTLTGKASITSEALSWLTPTLPVAFIALFAELGYAVLNNSTFPVYLKDGLGIDPVYIGPIMMPFFLSELFKGPLGVLADRIGRKPLMVVGPAITIITPILVTLIPYHSGTVFLPYLVAFGLLRLLDGLGASALWPAMFAYLGDVVRPEKRASAMSVLNVTYMIGLALGFLAGGYVDDTFGPILARESVTLSATDRSVRYFPSFYLTSILFTIATILAVIGVGYKKGSLGFRGSAPTREDAEDEIVREPFSWSSVKQAISTVPGVLLLAFVTFFGIGCIALQVKIFALDEFGITETQFGLLFLWPAVTIGALAVPLGSLSDRWGQVKSIRLGFFVGAVSLWAMIVLFRNQHAREIALVVSGGLLGIGFVIAFPAWLAHLTTLTSQSHRGTIIGAASTAQGLGVLLGVLFGGWLYKHATPNPATSHVAPFVACAIFLSIGSILTFVVLKLRPET